MPPKPPEGWHIPVFVQVIGFILIVIAPFITAFLAWIFKDKKTIEVSANDSLQNNQREFIDSLINAANSLPELLKMNRELIAQDASNKVKIELMAAEILEMKGKIAALERDRDSWREQAGRVPHLEGQIASFQLMLQEKEGMNIELRRKNNELQEALIRRGLDIGKESK